MESFYLLATFRMRGSNGSSFKELFRTLKFFQPFLEVTYHQKESFLQRYPGRQQEQLEVEPLHHGC
jgi:hypothetical protein